MSIVQARFSEMIMIVSIGYKYEPWASTPSPDQPLTELHDAQCHCLRANCSISPASSSPPRYAVTTAVEAGQRVSRLCREEGKAGQAASVIGAATVVYPKDMYTKCPCLMFSICTCSLIIAIISPV